jgi:hypothetical protein
MNLNVTPEKPNDLEELALKRRIRVHDPFAEFLLAKPALHSFEISLLDCYRFAGHACRAITGAFLVTEAAVQKLFPESNVCERGDLLVQFGSKADEGATGPKSNVISFITGAWAASGFQGLGGKFRRQDLLSYDHADLDKSAVRFHRKSTGETVTVVYNPNPVLENLRHRLEFPESWRAEIPVILERSRDVIQISGGSDSK